jgi:hypothetical protein
VCSTCARAVLAWCSPILSTLCPSCHSLGLPKFHFFFQQVVLNSSPSLVAVGGRMAPTTCRLIYIYMSVFWSTENSKKNFYATYLVFACYKLSTRAFQQYYEVQRRYMHYYYYSILPPFIYLLHLRKNILFTSLLRITLGLAYIYCLFVVHCYHLLVFFVSLLLIGCASDSSYKLNPR